MGGGWRVGGGDEDVDEWMDDGWMNWTANAIDEKGRWKAEGVGISAVGSVFYAPPAHNIHKQMY